MVDWSLEKHRWWGVWVVGWEGEGELEGELRIRSVFWTVDSSAPGEEVAVGRGKGGDAWGGGGHELHELGLESVVRLAAEHNSVVTGEGCSEMLLPYLLEVLIASFGFWAGAALVFWASAMVESKYVYAVSGL